MISTISIYRPDTPPTLQATVSIDDKTVFKKRLMNEHYIISDFVSNTILDVQIGDYIVHNSENYYIEKVPNVTKINNSTFQYTIVFEGVISELNRKLFISSDGLADFSKNGTAMDFITDLVASINTISTGWTVGTVEASEYITMQFANESCRAVLTRIADTFKMEFEINSKEISLKTTVGNTTAYRFEYGRNLGLYKIERQSVQDQGIVTRMYGFGGTTNLPAIYEARSKRLIFEDAFGIRYLEKNVALYGVREGQFTDDSIFPKFTGTLTAATIIFDGLDKLFSSTKSYIEDSALDFDLNDYLIAGQTATIVFKTGDMAGMECQIWNFDDANHRIYFNAVVDTVSGYATPRYNEGVPVQPEIGDTYTLVNLSQPIDYVAIAEAALEAATQADLDKRSIPQVVYSLDIDPKYAENIALNLDAGDKIIMDDDDLGIIETLIRVNSIEYPLVNPFKINAIIADFVPYTRQEATANNTNTNAVQITLADRRAADLAALMEQRVKELRDNLFNSDGTLRTDILGNSVDNAISPDSKTELIDGAILWKVGLTYAATDINYKILGEYFKSLKQEITLDAAHATYPRIDVFYVDTNSNLHVAKGTPAAVPVAPTLEWYQLYVTSATILANATEPEGIDVDWVYLENEEWTTDWVSPHDDFTSIDFEAPAVIVEAIARMDQLTRDSTPSNGTVSMNGGSETMVWNTSPEVTCSDFWNTFGANSFPDAIMSYDDAAVIYFTAAVAGVDFSIDPVMDYGTRQTIVDNSGIWDSPYTGSKRIKVLVSVPETETNVPLHYVGELYQGGIIFWIDPTDNKKGLIGALKVAKSAVMYQRLSGSSSYGTGATGTLIGTGQANSTLLLANTNAAAQAVKYCADYTVSENGIVYDDWFLGSINDYQCLFKSKSKIPNLGIRTLWSSSEYSWNKAWCMTTDNGVGYIRKKNTYYDVRPIRAFDDSDIVPNIPIVSLTLANTKMTFTITSGTADVQNGVLSFAMKSSVEWFNNSILIIESLLSGVVTGTAVIKSPSNLNGYKIGDTSWQVVAMQLYKFAPNQTTLDGFRFTLAGSWANGIDLGLDDIRFQHTDVITRESLTLNAVQVTPINVAFTASASPAIENYNTLYASIYGQNPRVKLFYIEDGERKEAMSVARYEFTNGLISRIWFDYGFEITGFITLY